MARFDVYAVNGPVGLVLDVQADVLSRLHTRVVIPLIPTTAAQPQPVTQLRPIVRIGGSDYVLSTSEIAAVPCSTLRERVANLENQHLIIVNSIDFLLQGF